MQETEGRKGQRTVVLRYQEASRGRRKRSGGRRERSGSTKTPGVETAYRSNASGSRTSREGEGGGGSEEVFPLLRDVEIRRGGNYSLYPFLYPVLATLAHWSLPVEPTNRKIRCFFFPCVFAIIIFIKIT